MRLSTVKFDEIYCSDLGRTKETFSEISPFHSGTNVIYDSRIREKSGGILEGKLISDTRQIAEVLH